MLKTLYITRRKVFSALVFAFVQIISICPISQGTKIKLLKQIKSYVIFKILELACDLNVILVSLQFIKLHSMIKYSQKKMNMNEHQT